jgi:hypothetical protein
VRENRTQGSVRGRSGNWSFYLDNRGKSMKQKRKEHWGNLRTMGKYRYIFLVGGFWAGLFIVLTTLIELWPNGEFLDFRIFLIKSIVSFLIGGFLFGFFMWMIGEHSYKKMINKSEKCLTIKSS